MSASLFGFNRPFKQQFSVWPTLLKNKGFSRSLKLLGYRNDMLCPAPFVFPPTNSMQDTAKKIRLSGSFWGLFFKNLSAPVANYEFWDGFAWFSAIYKQNSVQKSICRPIYRMIFLFFVCSTALKLIVRPRQPSSLRPITQNSFANRPKTHSSQVGKCAALSRRFGTYNGKTSCICLFYGVFRRWFGTWNGNFALHRASVLPMLLFRPQKKTAWP